MTMDVRTRKKFEIENWKLQIERIGELAHKLHWLMERSHKLDRVMERTHKLHRPTERTHKLDRPTERTHNLDRPSPQPSPGGRGGRSNPRLISDL